MLVRAKKTHQKIVMGLLSFADNLKDTQLLVNEFQHYEEDEDRSIYLWKDEENGDLVALLGIEHHEEIILVRHVCVSPSYRGDRLSFRMLNDLQQLYPDSKITGTLETGSIIADWVQYG